MAMPDVVVEPIWAPGRIFLTATRRHVAFAVIVALAALWAARPLFTVIVRSLNRAEYEHYSHIVLLPCIVAYLLWLNRHSIVQRAQPGLAVGAIVIAMAGTVVWLADTAVVGDEPETRLAIAMGGVIVMWLGGFIACYGMAALRTVIFPFAFLLFMIPLPPKALHAVIVFLQHGSAEAVAVIFGLIGMPVFRQDLTFALPGLTILVAEECSGIRSSLALLISGLVMTYLFLRTTTARTTLGVLIIPLAIVKNGVRIVVLSWLAVHVDPSFITESVVHRTGGIPTFLLSLAVLGVLIWVLRKSEQAITARRQLSTL
jgi:exosortase